MTAFAIDRAHTDILFSAKHLMVTTVHGTFTDFEGEVDLDEADPTRSSATFRVRAASVDTSFAARDNHLRSADFFDVERYPEILVRSTAVRPKRNGEFAVTADVTSETSRGRSRSTSSSWGSSSGWTAAAMRASRRARG